MYRGYEEGSSADENSESEHQSQKKFPDEVATNVSFSIVNPVIIMKEEVNRAYKEGSSVDENSELEHQSQRKFPDQVAANILVRFPDLVREPGFKRLHNPCH